MEIPFLLETTYPLPILPLYVRDVISTRVATLEADQNIEAGLTNTQKLEFFYNQVPIPIAEALVAEISTGWDEETHTWKEGREDKFRRKVNHTLINVPLAAMDILLKTYGSLEECMKDPKLKKKVIAIMYHDLARFEQVMTTGTFDDKLYEHGFYGALKARRSLIDLVSAGQIELDEDDIQSISESVYEHNKRFLNSDVSDIETCRFVRDADKDAILREERQMGRGNGTFENIGITNGLFEAFMAGKVIGNNEIESSQDQCLHRLAWIFDIGEPALQILYEERILEDIVMEIFGSYNSTEYKDLDQKIKFWKIVEKIDKRMRASGLFIDSITDRILSF